MDISDFIKSYWNYYIELEKQFLETKKYVEFDKSNYKTFSIEYLKLFQAVCSEIDVVGKEIASALDPNFKSDKNTNIQKWGYAIQQVLPYLKDVQVWFYEIEKIKPFENWAYEYYNDNKGRKRLREVASKGQMIPWWKDYNTVKHQRVGLVSGTKNFNLANQENLVNALAALYVLEYFYIRYYEEKETHGVDWYDTSSLVFCITN